jgi:endonuclease/exonuclease/phosphatase family metal-dependent hydrolase
LSFWGAEQFKQAEALCGMDWTGGEACRRNLILCGDFNALPNSPACRILSKRLEDVQLKLDRHQPLNTWFGYFPLGRIDHIFVSPGIGVDKIQVPSTRLEKLASDHLPLIADLKIR